MLATSFSSETWWRCHLKVSDNPIQHETYTCNTKTSQQCVNVFKIRTKEADPPCPPVDQTKSMINLLKINPEIASLFSEWHSSWFSLCKVACLTEQHAVTLKHSDPQSKLDQVWDSLSLEVQCAVSSYRRQPVKPSSCFTLELWPRRIVW